MSVNNRTKFLSMSGIRNRNKNAECEDVIFIDEESSIKFYGLADGQTKKLFCKEGGIETLKTVFKYISDKGISQIIQSEYIDEIKYEIMALIRKSITDLSVIRGTDKTEFASTLVVFSYDIKTEEYIAIHIGDGGIVENNPKGEINIISPPENGLSINYTWLTTSSDALFHLRICFGNIKTCNRIVMFTDGTEICRGKNISERIKKLICSENSNDIIDYIKQINPIDDASCIVLDF